MQEDPHSPVLARRVQVAMVALVATLTCVLSWNRNGAGRLGREQPAVHPSSVQSSTTARAAREGQELDGSPLGESARAEIASVGHSSLPPSEEGTPPIPAIEAASRARQYYARDRGRIRSTFMDASGDQITGRDLLQKFEFPDWVDADSLALLVATETIDLQERLLELAEEYMSLLDSACDEALKVPSEVVASADAKSIRRTSEQEMHRILADAGGQTFVFRLMAEDPERVGILREESRKLRDQRMRRTIDTLILVTGETPQRRRSKSSLSSRQVEDG